MNMKRMSGYALTVLFGALVATGCDNGSGVEPDRDLESNIDSVSYGIGYINGEQMSAQGMDDVELEAFMAGVSDGMGGEESVLSDQQLQTLLTQYQVQAQQRAQQRAQEEGMANMEEAEAFLEENRQKEGVTETDSGLQYEVLEEGSGESPEATDTVRVNYTGTLIDGTEFDSSPEGGIEFPLDGVIPGWTEGVQLMQEGARYRFYIPGNLAYGQNPPRGSQIGVNETLIFEVELLEVK